MTHLIFKSNHWHFNRRVPVQLRDFDHRKFIRFSLRTDSKAQAKKLAALENIKLENYWQTLIASGKTDAVDYYKSVVDRAGYLGFTYVDSQSISQLPLPAIISRVNAVQQNFTEQQAEAVLGGAPQPVLNLSDALAKFWDLSNDIVLTKSTNQIRKWKNPRKLAMKNFIAIIGNKAVADLTREDALKFRTWWIGRIDHDKLSPGTANKHFIFVKTIIGKVNKEYKLGLDVNHIFSDFAFEEDDETRPPFTTEHIVNVLLNPEKLIGLNPVYQAMLQVFAETGVLFSEQTGILPEDIILSASVPHIIIKPDKKKKLKTKYRKRIIPLTGYALKAFQQWPKGFSEFIDQADIITTAVGKYLRENHMLPSDRHSTYSLRHSFQDRLLAADTPDRIQADLMGHKFQRPKYGDGPTLEHKLEYLLKIKLT